MISRASNAAPRRFYAACDTASAPGGVAIRLDGKGARTPMGAVLVAPTKSLADLVAGEWNVQGERIVLADMPATRLLHTALDAVPSRRSETAASVAEIAATDLLCYFADHPRSLVERQERAWRPLIAWARESLDLPFATGQGVTHVAQPPATLAAIERLAQEMDDFALSATAFGAALFGSAILILALKAGRITGAQAHAAARLDDTFQEERWGADPESAGRVSRLEAEAVMLERWFGAQRE